MEKEQKEIYMQILNSMYEDDESLYTLEDALDLINRYGFELSNYEYGKLRRRWDDIRESYEMRKTNKIMELIHIANEREKNFKKWGD